MEWKRKQRGGGVQHNTTNSKTTLGLHAVASDMLVVDNIAVLGDVPWYPTVTARRVDRVGRGLNVDSVGPDGQERDVKEDGKDGEEDVQEPHCYFDQVEKHAHYADDKVVLCVAGCC